MRNYRVVSMSSTGTSFKKGLGGGDIIKPLKIKLKSLTFEGWRTNSRQDTRCTRTGDFMKKVPTATCALRNRKVVSVERVYTPSTFYIKSAVPGRFNGTHYTYYIPVGILKLPCIIVLAKSKTF